MSSAAQFLASTSNTTRSTGFFSRATTYSTYDQSLSSFAPELLKHILSNTSSLRAPFVTTFESVGFFADVSGFTKATESLSNAMGYLGTEILANKINAYLPQIAKKIVGSGGDVVKFAGDALLCIWPPPTDTIYNPHEEEFRRLEKKWRKFQNLTDKQKEIIERKKPELNRQISELTKKFEAIKIKYLEQKYLNETRQREAVEKNAHAAIQCAIEIQDNFGRMDLSGYSVQRAEKNRPSKFFGGGSKDKDKQNQKIEFRVKLGIGIGKIHMLIVGGNLGRCEYLICGDGLIQAFDCENDCSTDEDRMIIISDKVADVKGISDNFVLKKVPLEDGKTFSNNLQVVGVNKQSKNRHKIPRQHYGHLIPDMSNNLAVLLANYVPAAVKPHLDMPQQIWTGELREVTILFIQLPWNARSFAKFTNKILVELQKIIYTLQDVIYKYQGSLNKFLIDDKGSTVMAVFGLPPVAHSNDPIRGVLAALELREKIGQKKQPAAIGISCGTVFVGIIGSKGIRREYGILGDKVNLTARLMGLSKKNPVKLGEIVVDDSVYQRCQSEERIEWKDLGDVWVKGKKGAVHIYRPARNNIPISAHKIGQALYLETSDKVSLKQINREIDIFLNHSHPANNKRQRNGRVILVEGEIGNGKTSLLGQVQVRNAASLWFLWGKANEFHECYSVDYIVWKQILLGYTLRYSMITPKNRYLFQQYVKCRRPDLEHWLFLLTDLMELGNYKLLQDEFLPVQYCDRNKFRVDSTPKNVVDCHRHDIVFTLLEWTARVKPIAIIIDELQSLTKKDWQITRRLCCLIKQKVVKNVMILLSATPMDNPRYRPLFKPQSLVNNYIEIRNKFTHKLILPSSWGPLKTKFYITKYLDIGDCENRLLKTIHSQCGGRPGFVEQFLSELTAPQHQGKYIRIVHNKNKQQAANQQQKQKTHRSRKNNSSVLSPRTKARHNELCATFEYELDERFKIGLDVSFPIPSYILQITLSHIDKCNTEQLFVLKIASIICKSKGNNSVQFEEHMIRGCHPLADIGFNAKRRLRSTLNKLCEMQFIFKRTEDGDLPESILSPHFDDDIGVDLDNEESHLPEANTSLHKKPSYNNFEFPDEEESKKETAVKDDANHVDNTEFDGITDPMPSSKALLQAPSRGVPYKRGKMYKRGVNFINMSEAQRIFVFKHRTLYWIKDENEEYPRSRIKFDLSVQKLKREDQRTCSIKTPRKEYILRCNKKKDMDQWFKLFSEALKANYLDDAMLKRMHQFTQDGAGTTTKKRSRKEQPKTAPPAVPNQAYSSLYKAATSIQQQQSSQETSMSKQRSHTSSLSGSEKTKKTVNMADLLGGYAANSNGATASEQKPSVSPRSAKKVGFAAAVHNEESDTKTEEMDANADEEEEDDDDEEDGTFTHEDVARVLSETYSKQNVLKIELDEEEDMADDDVAALSPALLDNQISTELMKQFSVSSADSLLSPLEEKEAIGAQADDSCYEFAYGFLRDVIYEQMLHAQRKQLHTHAQKYIAKCLEQRNDDKLALLHTRHIECVQKYSAMLQGDDSQQTAFDPRRKRKSHIFGSKKKN